MSRLREKLYKEYKLEELGYDFLGYTFDSKKELSTHHILPRHSGGKTKKDNLCVLNRFTSHNYIHLIEDTDYKVFLELSKYLLEEVKRGEIEREQLLRIADALQFFEFKYRNEEDRHGERLIKPEYKTKRIILGDKNENK
jgi:hypothetical protein